MLVPHLHFKGECAGAMALYARAFGATVDTALLDEGTGQVIHAEMTIHGQRVMLNDNRSSEEHSDFPFAQMVVIFGSKEELLRTYDIINEGSVTVSPISETAYSVCTVGFWDKYGIRWGFMV